ncbi:MAG: hypothetical protein JWQ97_3391 [Phenylobacterium sp.]|nr:hypothetical protein [Phenylobacterium sp.]
MVAYSFKSRFAPPIQARAKRQTIRADRKRHARRGEQLQLYVGMRTKSCRLIGLAQCVGVMEVRLDFDERRVEFGSGTAVTTPDDTDAFARADGFADWRDMEAFWAAEHPGVRQFTGILISWGETLQVAA